MEKQSINVLAEIKLRECENLVQKEIMLDARKRKLYLRQQMKTRYMEEMVKKYCSELTLIG